MPTIYAICNCEIVLNNSIIIEKRKTLSEINSEIIDENTSCIEEYTMPVTDELGVTKDEKYVIIRFVAWNASHDLGHKGISIENKINAVKEFSSMLKSLYQVKKNYLRT